MPCPQVEAADHARNWTTGMLEFHRVLSTLSEITSQHAKGGASSGDDSDVDSDASDGEKQEEKAKLKKKEKSKKKNASKEDVKTKDKSTLKNKSKSKSKSKAEATPPAASPSDDEEGSKPSDEDAGVQNVKRVKFATHIGRFKRRESAKVVKNYSSNDLAAILGGDPFASVAAAVNETQRDDSSSDSDESDSEDAPSAPAAAPAQQMAVATPFQQAMAMEHREEDVPADEGDHWWSGYFTRAGRLGSMRSIKPGENGQGIKAHGFSEQDQTNLYNLAQDNATQGRIGLGRSSMPKKVAGVRWQGKKQRLGSDDEDDEAELDAQGGAGPQQLKQEAPADEGVVIIMPPSKQQQKLAGKKVAPVKEDATEGGDLGSVKWKKAVSAVLKTSKKQRIKVSKLHKAIAEQHGLGPQHKDIIVVKVTEVVTKSSKFVLEDGMVRMAAD